VNVSCPECRSVFRVDPSKLPATTVRARCSVCGGVITISDGYSIEDEFGSKATAVSPSVAPAAIGSATSIGQLANATKPRTLAAPEEFVTAGSSVASSERSDLAASRPGVLEPAANFAALAREASGSTNVSPVVPSTGPTSVPPSAPAPTSVPQASPGNPAFGARTAQSRPVLFPPRPMVSGGASSAGGNGPTRQAVAPARPITPPAATPHVLGSPAPSQRPVGPLGVASAPNISATSVRPPAPSVAGTSTGTGTPARAPINPFLANDPHAKAKRLARALVSDLVTYFPQKREEGLRDGTLKQLFKDEIQKSYEEYVLQVGREFAETTPHFQDALNDILARGQKVF
jgi:predicted Zn finger-like uncharacterized protein